MTCRVLGPWFLCVMTSAAADVDGLTLPFKTVRLSSGVQEIIAEIKVQEGDTVKKNQVLARLHDEKERAEHERAEKIVEKRDFDAVAARALVADKITSREKALEAEIELKVAKVDVAGTPAGTCGEFSVSGCNASSSEGIVSTECVGKSS